MDKLKPVLRNLAKYHFWVISAVITLVGLLVWYYAYSNLTQQFAERSSKINSSYDTLENVKKIANHPNDQSHLLMGRNVDATLRSVTSAWQLQYEYQQSLLVWPLDQLQQDFGDAVNHLRPIEKLDPKENKIAMGLRDRYRNYIRNVLPRLADHVQAAWQVDTSLSSGSSRSGGMSGMGGFGGSAGPAAGAGAGGKQDSDAPEKDIVVDWNAANQKAIASRYDWSSEPPSTQMILYAQEDFWVINSLLDIIARTNDGADANYKAAIKQIESIDIGAMAVAGYGGNIMTGSSSMSGGSMGPSAGGGMSGMPGGGGGMSGMPGGGGGMSGQPSGGGMSGMPGGGGGMSGMPGGGGGGMSGMPGGGGMSGMPGGSSGPASASAAGDLANMRYVDLKFQPIDATRLRSVFQSKNAADATLKVAKRMPIRLRLNMDMRKVNRLLAECGNSRLPVEVRQVRINKPFGSSGGMMGGMGGGGMGGMLGQMSGASGGGAGASASLGGASGSGGGSRGMGGMGGGSAVQVSYDGPVEIIGLIYLFNPPDDAPPTTATATAGAAPGGSVNRGG